VTISGSSGGALIGRSSRHRVSHPGIAVSHGERRRLSGCGGRARAVPWSHHAERVRTHRAPRRVLTDGTDSPRCSASCPWSCQIHPTSRSAADPHQTSLLARSATRALDLVRETHDRMRRLRHAAARRPPAPPAPPAVPPTSRTTVEDEEQFRVRHVPRHVGSRQPPDREPVQPRGPAGLARPTGQRRPAPGRQLASPA